MGEWVPVIDGVVGFALEYSEEDYKLCYLFDGEEPMMYPEIRLSVLHVNEITIDDGARNDAIIFKVDNAIRITGMTFPGDKIYPLANPLNEPVTSFTSSDCLEGIPLDEYIARSEDGAFHVSVVTGGSVLICYLFEGETKPTLTSFNLLVLGVINPTMRVGEEELIGTANLWAVKNVTTHLSFQSSDTVHEARYKWVANDAADCDAPGEGMEYDEDGSRALLYDAEYERMYDEFALTNTTTANYKLCYQFSGKRWVFLSEQSQGDVYPPLTLESRGLSVVEPERGDWTADTGYEAGARLASDPSATAIYVANDQMAMGVVEALRDAGRRVPEDVSVAGVDDSLTRSLPNVTLTTVRFDLLRRGRTAVEHALLGSAPGYRPVSIRIAPTLVERSSVADLR